MNYIFASFIVLFSFASNAQILSAILTYDTKIITPEGVTKQTHFQEQFIRDDKNIWSQRIVPKHTIKVVESHEDEHEEHNLNFALAGKWLYKNAAGEVIYKLARTNEKTLIEPRITEYATLGFDGDWEAAYFLVSQKELKQFQKANRKAPNGAQWYKQDQQGSTRWVLWDNQRQFPLVMEQSDAKGTSSTRITTEFTQLPATFPWAILTNFQVKAYEDLLD